MCSRRSGRRSGAAGSLVVHGGRSLVLAFASTILPIAPARAAPPRAPPSPRISPEDGLAISRSARADRRLGAFTPRSDGGLDYRDPQGRFRAQISEDGRVTFRGAIPIKEVSTLALDRHGALRLRGLPTYLLSPEKWKREVSANEIGGALHGGMADPMTQHLSTVEKTEVRRPGQLFYGFSGRFGRPLFTDRLKAEFLRETRELRLEMAVKSERRRLARALGELEAQLGELWETTTLPPEERRRALFELWDECLERLAPTPDAAVDELGPSIAEQRVRAAVEARRRILSFIRYALPSGSELAYSAEELRRLNQRRRSRERFEPYR